MSPAAAATSSPAVCSICSAPQDIPDGLKLLTCGRCRVQKYCGKNCQKADWSRHRKTCRPAFGLPELEDPQNAAAAAARNRSSPYGFPFNPANPMPYHQTYHQVFGRHLNETVPDRRCQCAPGANNLGRRPGGLLRQHRSCRSLFIAEAMPGAALPIVGSTTNSDTTQHYSLDLEPGQYHSTDFGACPPLQWDRYYAARGPTAPGNVGGFHKAVIDTQQPASKWTLSAKLVSTDMLGHLLYGPAFIAIARRLSRLCGVRHGRSRLLRQSFKNQGVSSPGDGKICH